MSGPDQLGTILFHIASTIFHDNILPSTINICCCGGSFVCNSLWVDSSAMLTTVWYNRNMNCMHTLKREKSPPIPSSGSNSNGCTFKDTYSRFNCGYTFLQLLGYRPSILVLQYVAIACFIYGSRLEVLMGFVNYFLTLYVSGLKYFRVLCLYDY